jgi:hypothetical protein
MASLPLNWQQILKDIDGRTHRYTKQRNGKTKRGGAG